MNNSILGRRWSSRSRARPTALPSPSEGVDIEVRRVDVPRRRGMRIGSGSDSIEGGVITDGLMEILGGAACTEDDVERATGRMRFRTTPVWYVRTVSSCPT